MWGIGKDQADENTAEQPATPDGETVAAEPAPLEETPPEPPADTGAVEGHPTVEKHAEDAKTPAWLFAAARALRGWPQGQQVSKEDFDAALEEAGNVVVR